MSNYTDQLASAPMSIEEYFHYDEELIIKYHTKRKLKQLRLQRDIERSYPYSLHNGVSDIVKEINNDST